MSSNERDPALDKAWRAHSRETPPPALDAQILAAAHRAVGSKPKAATGAPKWWMPIMAAAVIGVVAIGVIQLAPPEQPALDTTSSSIVASVQPKKVEPAQAPAADAPKAVAEPEVQAKKQKEAPPPPVVAKTPAPARLAAQEAPRENKVVAERKAEPQPFPAAPPPQKTEATDDKRAGALAGREAAAGFAADAVTSGGKRDEVAQARKDVSNERQLAAAAPPPAAPAAAPAPAPAQPARSMEADRGRAQVSGMLQKNAASTAPAESASEKARDPDAWIARIRKLRDEGQTAEALRELREFRANVPDAEKRLPADLRDWKP